MKEIKWPDRLMTWLRMGDQAMELRFRREPNLFSDSNYFLYQIQIGMSIPKDLFFSLPAEHDIYIGAGRVFLANNPHPIKHIEV